MAFVACANSDGPSASRAVPAPAVSVQPMPPPPIPPSGFSRDPGFNPGFVPIAKLEGGALSEAQMASVVREHKADLVRACWTGTDAGASARETVTISIDGDGHVAKAVAVGNNVVVGTCLERELRAWGFPATGGTTGPVDVPFKFPWK